MLWEFTNEQWLTSFTVICCLAFICGWIADKILGYGGFSVLGNWLILLTGAYVGLLCYNLLGHRFSWNTQFTMMLALGSSLGMLFVMLSVKAMLQFR